MTTASGDAPAISSFGEDAVGEPYLCDYFAGDIYRFVVPIAAKRAEQLEILATERRR